MIFVFDAVLFRRCTRVLSLPLTSIPRLKNAKLKCNHMIITNDKSRDRWNQDDTYQRKITCLLRMALWWTAVFEPEPVLIIKLRRTNSVLNLGWEYDASINKYEMTWQCSRGNERHLLYIPTWHTRIPHKEKNELLNSHFKKRSMLDLQCIVNLQNVPRKMNATRVKCKNTSIIISLQKIQPDLRTVYVHQPINPDALNFWRPDRTTPASAATPASPFLTVLMDIGDMFFHVPQTRKTGWA